MTRTGGDAASVVVIGAGLAGLTAAHQLRAAGLQVVVLEATERVGGRAYTIRDGFEADQQCDLGGELLLASYEAIPKLCADLGVETSEDMWLWREIAPEDTMLDAFFHEGHLMVGGEVLRGERFATAYDQVKTAFREVPPAHHELTGAWIERAGLTGDAKAAVSGFSKLVQYDPHQMDVSALIIEFGAYTINRVVGGSQVLAEALAKGLDVRLNSPARVVRQSSAGVEVELEDGERLSADRVVVAVPVFVLGTLGFDPPLPANLPRAVSSLQRARGGKVACQYAEGDAIRAALTQVVCGDGPINTAFVSNPYTKEGPAVVSGFITGGDRYILETAGAAAAALDEVVTAVVGGPVTRLATREINWTTEPYVRAITSYADAHGRGGGFAAQFAIPHGRVHFAGDHTDVLYQGSLEGAALSGMRAADEILRAPSRVSVDEIESKMVEA